MVKLYPNGKNINISRTNFKDKLSNKHEGIIKDSRNMPQLAFLMYDQNGTKIKPMGASLGTRAVDNGEIGQGYMRCAKLENSVSRVKIVPYIDNQDKDSTYNKELKSKIIEVEIK